MLTISIAWSVVTPTTPPPPPNCRSAQPPPPPPPRAYLCIKQQVGLNAHHFDCLVGCHPHNIRHLPHPVQDFVRGEV